jgi:hypothetical protein
MPAANLCDSTYMMHATSADAGDQTGLRMVLPAFRWILIPFTGLAIGASWSLFLVPARTDEFFAWTIQPPLTAALLGAAYGGTVLLFGLGLREKVWVNLRILVAAPLVLSTLMLVATLIHLEKFHLDADPIPTAVAWIWLIIYLVVPPALLLLMVGQHRAPGVDPPRSSPMPAVLRGAMLVYGALSVAGGAVLFVVPEEVAPHWPWAITALTGRALAAWMAGLGVAAVQAFFEADLRRVRIGLVSFTVIGVLGLIAIGRFNDEITWNAGGWVTVAYFGLMVGAGLLGWLVGRSR